jgi:predicted nucleotidyltransferase
MSLANLILKNSKERKAIFSQFISNEGEEFYLRELERITGISVGNIRRELNKYLDEELFITRKKGNLLFYKINTDHNLYPELKKILQTEIGIEADLKKELEQLDNLDFSFIFGSYAKGEAKTGSDIDLMIIGKPERKLLLNLISKLEKKYNRDINYQVNSKSTWLKKKKAKNSFVLSIVKGSTIVLIGDESEI